MTAAAVIPATFSDWKLIKTRGVVQLVFEIPIENADAAYQVVGGMPNAATERWFAIARLNESKRATPPAPAGEAEAHKVAPVSPTPQHWGGMSPAQQSGMLCNEQKFQTFIREVYSERWRLMNNGTDAERAALIVRSLCSVKSRSELAQNEAAARIWRSIVSDYRAWIVEAEVVPA